MLVLSRKAGERIDIGDDITIEVRKVAGNRVTIALEAPRHLRILRSELREVVKEFEVVEEPPTEAPTDSDAVRAVVHHRLTAAATIPA